MEPRTPVVAVGAAVTASLVVTVAVIELLDVEFSALVGLPAGALAGAAVLVAVLSRFEAAGQPLRWGTAGAAGFGYGVALVLAAGYVNLADVDFEATVGLGVAAGALAVLATAFTDRRRPPAR